MRATLVSRVTQIVPRFDYRIAYKVVEDIGRSRDTNEDAHLVDPTLALFAVADGMGGHAAGEIASRLAIEEVRRSIGSQRSQSAIEHYVREPTLENRRAVLARLRRSIEHANERVREEARKDPAHTGMGTTLDVVWLARDHAFVAHAGDGRVYLARPSTVLQLTQDHVEAETLKATGLMSPHKRTAKHQRLMNAVGIAERVDVDTLFVDLSKGDRLLLCSDGVHGQLDTEAELSELLRTGNAEAAARALIARVAQRGRDNATALVIELAERFVRRTDDDRGFRARDIEKAQLTPIFQDLPLSTVMAALAASVEIEVEAEQMIPQVVASDFVAYVVLDGLVRCDGDRVVTVGALLFPESLVGVPVATELPIAAERTRMLRLRADDFAEVCNADRTLSSELHRRLAIHLARSRQRGPVKRSGNPGTAAATSGTAPTADANPKDGNGTSGG
ncbi:MAG TPA: protein phosphatase 2C domain-containing protein [Polyangiaceae bacterium]|nr:protein phosphatase 2C domain-containing protein [Polyangiaceae bacterium]